MPNTSKMAIFEALGCEGIASWMILDAVCTNMYPPAIKRNFPASHVGVPECSLIRKVFPLFPLCFHLQLSCFHFIFRLGHSVTAYQNDLSPCLQTQEKNIGWLNPPCRQPCGTPKEKPYNTLIHQFISIYMIVTDSRFKSNLHPIYIQFTSNLASM